MANQQDNERSSNNQSGRSASEDKGNMSVREAGHLGGQRERELVEEGKQSEGNSGSDER